MQSQGLTLECIALLRPLIYLSLPLFPISGFLVLHAHAKTSVSQLASIPGRVFAFITVRRTTGPGTSCLRMRQPISPFLAISIIILVHFCDIYIRVLSCTKSVSVLPLLEWLLAEASLFSEA